LLIQPLLFKAHKFHLPYFCSRGSMKRSLFFVVIVIALILSACSPVATPAPAASSTSRSRRMTRHQSSSTIKNPINNDVYVAKRGVLWVELKTHGKAAHTSQIRLGRNAVQMMIPLLERLNHLDIKAEDHPLLGGFEMSVNMIQGGEKINTIPDSCLASIDFRTIPGQDHDQILSAIDRAIKEVAKLSPVNDFRASCQAINNRRPLSTSADEAIVQAFLEVVSQVTGQKTTPKGAGFFTDATEYVPVLNVPFTICGPGDPQLNHQTNEYIRIDRLIESARIYTTAAICMLS
jgi:succinyl-diaminopimelate desuccinylase